MPFTVFQIADMITATLFDEKDHRLSDLTPDLLRNYVAARRLFTASNKTMIEQGGKAVRFDVNVARGNVAEWVPPFKVEQTAIGDSIQQGKDEMRFIRTYFSFDQMEEVFNSGKFQIVDYIKNRHQNALIDMTQKCETQFWGETAYADRTLKMNGILNLLPYVATEGFNGTYASGYSSVHDLDPTVYAGWKSYGAPYVAITQDDVVIKMRRGWSRTRFEAPLDAMLIPNYKEADQYGLYMNLDTVQQFENQLRLQNDSLGDDVAYESGRAMFKNTPLTDVAALDSNARNPIFGINWGLLDVYKLKGWWDYPIVQPGANQPTVVNTFIYRALQLITEDRRQLGFNFALAA
jgi:hypothetical protein